MNRKKWLMLSLVLAFALAGCATTGGLPPPAPEQTLYQKAQLRYVYLEGLYAAQLRDTASMGAMAQAGKLSIEQVRVYRVKRAGLIKAKALLEAYDTILLDGGIPATGRDEEITNLLNQLASMAGSGGVQ
jgi:hypothetical protein